MVTNEVSNTPEAGQSAPSEKSLSIDILDTMIQTFKETQSDKVSAATGTEKTEPAANAEEFALVNAEEFVKAGQRGERMKGGEYWKLQSAVGAADKALANNPGIHKQIAKLEFQELQLQTQSFKQQDIMRDTARNTFSKEDMKALDRLGHNPLRDPLRNEKQMPFDFNNAQRAWLKENHPDVYKQLERHDQTSLEITNTNENLRQLGETRDRPTNARIDLARYQHRMGMDAEAIATLTDAIHTNPSIVTRQTKADEFRSVAMETGAAWDPAFRKAVETSGGNILDFVRRPVQDHGIKARPPLKQLFNFRPENLNR